MRGRGLMTWRARATSALGLADIARHLEVAIYVQEANVQNACQDTESTFCAGPKHWNTETSAHAARGGDVAALQRAHGLSCPWDWRTCAVAAEGRPRRNILSFLPTPCA
jgi:hypothetical protein